MINKKERQTPPFAESMGSFTFPEFSEHQLSGGAKVFLVQNKKQPLINIRIMPEKGSADGNIPGLSSFTMQMLTNGTKNRSASEIAEEAEFFGAKLNSQAKWDYSLLSINSLSDFADESLELLEDCLFNPAFHEEEIERHRRKVLADIHQNNADPNRLARLAFNSLMHNGTPYKFQTGGTISSVASITQEDIRSRYESLIDETPFNIIVSGYFDREKILEKLEEKFGRLNSKASLPPEDFTLTGSGTKVVIIEKPEASQVSLRVGRQTLNPRHPDYPAMQTASVIFGGYFLSRINELLREKLGYTYGVNTSIDSRRHSSVMVTASALKKDTLNDSAAKILSEMKKMSAEPVDKEELFRASQFILGSFVRSVESPQQTASLLMGIITHSLKKDYYNFMFKKIKSLTSEELFEVQKEYFKPEGMVFSASGEKKDIISALSIFGEMYECSTEGNIEKI